MFAFAARHGGGRASARLRHARRIDFAWLRDRRRGRSHSLASPQSRLLLARESQGESRVRGPRVVNLLGLEPFWTTIQLTRRRRSPEIYK